MSGEPMALRPHHGMCMAYFVGLGYSGGFSAHMAELLEELAPGVTVDEVLAKTGAELIIPEAAGRETQ